MEEESLIEPKARVLIIENNPTWRGHHKRNLGYWGYEAHIVGAKGKDLSEQAKVMAKKYRCHFAILDMHLINDSDKDDTSGLDLIVPLFPVRSIIVSSAYDLDRALEAVKDRGALDYIVKSDNPEKLKFVLDKASNRFSVCKQKISFRWPKDNNDFPKGTIKSFFPQDNEIPQNEIEEILFRLFPKAKYLQIDNIGGSTRTPFSSDDAPRPKSIILEVKADEKIPCIVKIASEKKIKDEGERFNQYIKDNIETRCYALLERSELLWDLGGAVYTKLGSSNWKDFTRYYSEAEGKDIGKSLKHFFNAWKNLYTKTKNPQNESLYKAYCRVWKFKWSDWLKEYALSGSPDGSSFNWKKIGALDPFQWFLKNINEKTDASALPDTSVADTHGDMHGGNLMVDEQGNIWSIDFERSGPGPILQDFVELEIDILTRLVNLGENDYKDFFKLCIYIAQSKEIKIKEFDEITNNHEIIKATTVIYSLRKIASQITCVSDARQYLWGLLFNTYFRLFLINEKEDDHHRWRTMMLASILCHRLENWDKPWPPQEWKNLSKPDPIINNEIEIKKLFEACDEFKNQQVLTAVFSDLRIQIFKNGLPFSANNLKERTDLVYDYLYGKKNDKDKSGLLLFLEVLNDRYQPGDSRKNEIEKLIKWLSKNKM